MEKLKEIWSKRNYSWVILIICFFMVFLSLGLCSSGRTLYLTAITDALNLPRGAFSLNNTFRFVTSAILNLFFGPLVARFGTKKLICAGFVCLILFSVINTYTTTLLGFYIAGVFLGIGLAWTTTTMTSTIINLWFKENKATIMGAVLAANGIGGAIAVQILSPIIFQEGNPFGYRTSYQIVSIVLTIMLLLVLFFYRTPAAGQKEVAVKKKKKVRGAGWVGMEFEEVIRKPYFYIALLCVFFTGMALQGLGGIAVPHMYDVGLSVEFVAALVSFGGLMLTVTKFLTGYFYDHFGMRIAMNICLLSALFSVFTLAFVDNSLFGKILSWVRNFIGTFGTPLDTVMLPIFAAEYFGNKAFDRTVGIFVAVSQVGFAVGSPFGNLLHDFLGDYRLAFLLFAAMMVVVVIAQQFVLSAANRDRKRILAALEEKPLAVQ